MKHGARNNLPAEATAIKRGAVMCQVDVRLAGASCKMTSVMTLDSLDSLGLKVGDKVNVLAKAVNVPLTKD